MSKRRGLGRGLGALIPTGEEGEQPDQTTAGGGLRMVATYRADGQTIQKPDGRGFGPSDWDGDLPSQKICTEIDAPAVLKLIHDVIVSVRED